MKLDWRHITVIILSVLLMILVVLLAAMILHDHKGKPNQESSVSQIEKEDFFEESSNVVVENESSRVNEESSNSDKEESKTEEKKEETKEEIIDAAKEDSSEVQKEESGSTNSKGETASSIEIPYAIPGTTLVIRQFNSYDGVFLEDGSDAEVTGISAIVVENTGDVGIEYADITINQGGTDFQYTASAIPAGTTIVVQEASGSSYSDEKIQDCSAKVALIDNFEMSSSMVEVVENESGTLSVTNIGSETIPCVRVFYKFALEKGEIYVGGITYTAKLTQLEPGVTQEVAPSHYVAGSSEIIMVRTYDTTE